MFNKLTNKIGDYISQIILRKIRSLREPQEVAEVTRDELWDILKKYQKTRGIEAEEYLILANYYKYLLKELDLI